MESLSIFLKRKHLLQLSVLIFFTSLATALTMPFMTLFLFQKLQATEIEIGFYISVSSFANLIISFPIGYVSDKIKDRKKILAIALMASFISYFMYGITENFNLIILVSSTIMGISFSVTPQLFALSKQILDSENTDEKKVTADMTLLRTMIPFSWAIGPLIGTIVLTYFNFKGIFYIASFIYFIVFLIIVFSYDNLIVPTKRVSAEDLGKEKNTRYIIITMYSIVFVLIQMVNSLISNYFPIYITDYLGYNNSYIGIIASFSAIVEIPLMIILVIITQKYDMKNILTLGFLSGILFIGIFSQTHNIIILILSYIFNAIFYSITIGLGMTFFQNIIPNKPGFSTTLFINTSSFGKILSGLVLGVIGNAYNYLFIYLLGMLILCLMLFNFLENKE